MIVSAMGTAELSNKISAAARDVIAPSPDFASIKQDVEQMIPMVEESGAPRRQEVADILRRSILLIDADGAIEARVSLGSAALKIKDHSRRP